jgi:hypothetical protein
MSKKLDKEIIEKLSIVKGHFHSLVQNAAPSCKEHTSYVEGMKLLDEVLEGPKEDSKKKITARLKTLLLNPIPTIL